MGNKEVETGKCVFINKQKISHRYAFLETKEKWSLKMERLSELKGWPKCFGWFNQYLTDTERKLCHFLSETTENTVLG